MLSIKPYEEGGGLCVWTYTQPGLEVTLQVCPYRKWLARGEEEELGEPEGFPKEEDQDRSVQFHCIG